MKLTKKAIEKAIIGSSGLISTIAQKLKVSRATVRNYLKKYPELEDLINEEKENLLDFTESKLIKKINDEESWAIKYFLSTQGMGRGYRSNISQIENIQPELGEDFHRLVEGMTSSMKSREKGSM
jgi:hypothetical protein